MSSDISHVIPFINNAFADSTLPNELRLRLGMRQFVIVTSLS